MSKLLVSLLLIGLWSGAGYAQEDSGQAGDAKAPPSADSRAERWRNVLEGKAPPAEVKQHIPGTGGEQMPAPQPPGAADLADPQTQEAYRGALREYYTYLQKGLQHRQRVFAWQHYSSITIFVVVILLVGAGVYFAAVQFHRGLGEAAAGGTATQFEAGPGGAQGQFPGAGRDHPGDLAGVLLSVPGVRLPDPGDLLTGRHFDAVIVGAGFAGMYSKLVVPAKAGIPG
jgi:hypothetical protein